MFRTRKVERNLFPNPEVNCFDFEKFPLINIMEFKKMKKDFCDDTDKVHLYFYVLKNSEGTPYIDIYVWDYARYEYNYRRFIICEGYCLSDLEEEEYLYYVDMGSNFSEYFALSNKDMNRLFKKVNKIMPSLHYCNYSLDNLSDALSHLYFASFRSGAREILYKSKLSNIAANLESLVSYDMAGTSPVAILNCDINMKLLRILNQPELVDNLLYYSTREHCINIYKCFSDYIDTDMVTPSQWRYLELLYEEGSFGGRGFSRALYRILEDDVPEIAIKSYAKYFELKNKMPELKLRLPKWEDVYDVVGELAFTYKFKEEYKDDDELVALRSKNPAYEYYNDVFEVKMPKDGMDMCFESINQGNCLRNYIEPHAQSKTTILFLRKRSDPQASFVDIEVHNGTITQAYATYNKIPDVDVYKFLEEYSIAKGLCYEPSKLASAGFDEDDVDDELKKYICDYNKRRGWMLDDSRTEEGYQTSLWELFPDLMAG